MSVADLAAGWAAGWAVGLFAGVVQLAHDGGKLGLTGVGNDDVASFAVAPVADADSTDLRHVQTVLLSVVARHQADGQPVTFPVLIDKSGQRMLHVAHHPAADQ